MLLFDVTYISILNWNMLCCKHSSPLSIIGSTIVSAVLHSECCCAAWGHLRDSRMRRVSPFACGQSNKRSLNLSNHLHLLITIYVIKIEMCLWLFLLLRAQHFKNFNYNQFIMKTFISNMKIRVSFSPVVRYLCLPFCFVTQEKSKKSKNV